jgi:hypothetical protein
VEIGRNGLGILGVKRLNLKSLVNKLNHLTIEESLERFTTFLNPELTSYSLKDYE